MAAPYLISYSKRKKETNTSKKFKPFSSNDLHLPCSPKFRNDLKKNCHVNGTDQTLSYTWRIKYCFSFILYEFLRKITPLGYLLWLRTFSHLQIRCNYNVRLHCIIHIKDDRACLIYITIGCYFVLYSSGKVCNENTRSSLELGRRLMNSALPLI